ncbi:MAG TPA: CBS domain-containing protein [Phycisphaerae bacterium]|jgi:CBS domain-containing protein
MAIVADILAHKGSQVFVVSPGASVLDATLLMNRHRIGALVVIENEVGEPDCDRVAGMFTERDVLTRVICLQLDPATTIVGEIMTRDVAFCRPQTDIDEVSAVMRERRIRHLPVCSEEGKLKGMVSIGDLNAWYARGCEAEIHYLQEYIHGRV